MAEVLGQRERSGVPTGGDALEIGWCRVTLVMMFRDVSCCFILTGNILLTITEWMDERCFRPLLCTVKAELGREQPGLMRWIWDETLPQSSIDRSTFYSAAHRATKWASGRPLTITGNVLLTITRNGLLTITGNVLFSSRGMMYMRHRYFCD